MEIQHTLRTARVYRQNGTKPALYGVFQRLLIQDLEGSLAYEQDSLGLSLKALGDSIHYSWDFSKAL